jgi:cellulose biosynthesis protein BcsQ
MSTINSHLVNSNSLSGFGERLKLAFDNAQNKEIASKLGVSNPAITAYLQGRVPPAEKLIEIADYTGCNLHWLLTGEGPKRVIDNTTEPSRAKTILFHCNKGGVGKSTASLLTAAGLVNRGYKTLLVDNVFGSCTLNLFYQVLKNSLLTKEHKSLNKARHKPTSADLIDPDEKMFFSTPIRGLDLVSFDKSYQLMLMEKKVRHFDLVPRDIQDSYSFIVVDAHSNMDPFRPLSLFMTMLLREAKVIIPFQPYNAMGESVRNTLEYIDYAQSFSEGIEFLGLFLNNYDTRTPMDVGLRREIELLVRDKLLHSTIHKSQELLELLPKGLENFYRTKSRVVREYGSLVTEILERLGLEGQAGGYAKRAS